MLRHRLFAPFALVLLVLALPPHAEALDPGKKLYVSAGSVDAVALIGPPPKLGSPAFHDCLPRFFPTRRTR